MGQFLWFSSYCWWFALFCWLCYYIVSEVKLLLFFWFLFFSLFAFVSAVLIVTFATSVLKPGFHFFCLWLRAGFFITYSFQALKLCIWDIIFQSWRMKTVCPSKVVCFCLWRCPSLVFQKVFSRLYCRLSLIVFKYLWNDSSFCSASGKKEGRKKM